MVLGCCYCDFYEPLIDTHCEHFVRVMIKGWNFFVLLRTLKTFFFGSLTFKKLFFNCKNLKMINALYYTHVFSGHKNYSASHKASHKGGSKSLKNRDINSLRVEMKLRNYFYSAVRSWSLPNACLGCLFSIHCDQIQLFNNFVNLIKNSSLLMLITKLLPT